jgi:hypothetical protein
MRFASRWVFVLACAVVSCGGGGGEDPNDSGLNPVRGPVSFVSEPVVVAHAGKPYVYKAEAKQDGAAAGDTITYSIAKGPSGLIIDGPTGNVTWTPDASQVGKHDVSIVATANDGQTARQDYSIGVDSIVVASISPAAGTSAGSEKVVIRGAGFSAGAKVQFGGVDAPTTFVDPTTLEVVTPPHTAGTFIVDVLTGGTVADSFKPGFTYLPRVDSLDSDKIAIGAKVTARTVGADAGDPSANVLSLPSSGSTLRRFGASAASKTDAVFSTVTESGEARPTSGAARVLVHGIQSNCVALGFTDATVGARLAVTSVKAGTVADRLVLAGTGFAGLPLYDGTASFDTAAPTALYVMFAGAAKPARVVSIAADGNSAEVAIPADAATGPLKLYAPGREPSTACVVAQIPGKAAAVGVVTFTPEGGPAGTAVVIEGSGFPTDPKAATVTVESAAAKVLSSEPNRLVIEIPSGVKMGPSTLTVSVGASKVDAGVFAVTGKTVQLAGGGAPIASTGDGGPAKAASINPGFVAVDLAGNHVVTDGARIRVVNRGTAPLTAYGKTIAPGAIDSVVDVTKIADAPASQVGVVAVHPVTQDLYFAIGPRIYRAGRGDGVTTPYAGTGAIGFSGDGGSRLTATFSGITDLQFTTSGTRKGALLVVADNSAGWVRVVNMTGVAVTLWGVTVGPEFVQSIEKTGTANPMSVALDASDNLLVTRFSTVVRIATDRPTRPAMPDASYVPFVVVAGDTSVEVPGSGCPATSIGLGTNNGIAYDLERGSYFLGSRNGLVRRVAKNSGGTDCVEFVAGRWRTGATIADIGYAGDGGAALSASIGLFARPFVDRDGSLLIAGDGRVRRVTFGTDAARTPGTIETVIGTGPILVAKGALGTTIPSIEALAGVVVDEARDRYIYAANGTIVGHSRKTNTVEVIAGTGIRGNFSEGMLAISTSIGVPRGMGIRGGELLLLETVLPRISATDLTTGKFRIITGDGRAATPAERIASGPLSSARVSFGTGAAKMAVAPSGVVFFADEERVRVMNPGSAPVTVFGTSVPGESVALVDGGFGSGVSGLALDKAGNLWVTTLDDKLIVKRNTGSFPADVVVAAGSEPAGYPVPTTLEKLKLNDPTDIAVTPAGDLVIANALGGSLTFIAADATGAVTAKSRTAAVLGNGVVGVTSFTANPVALRGTPTAVALDGNRILVISDVRLFALDP